MKRIKQPKGYRQVSNGRFRAEIYDEGRVKNLGTYLTEEEAAHAFKLANEERLRRNMARYGYFLEDGVTYECNYTVFADGTIFGPSGTKIKYMTTTRGYLTCTLNGHDARVHRVIAECFIPNPYNKPQVNHINGDKSDNRACNLEWCTASENTRHAHANGLAHGTGKSRRGDKTSKAKLTWDIVRYIRDVYCPGDPEFNQSALARRFGVGSNAVHNIIHNNTWIED